MLFFVRGIWMARSSALLRQPWVRIVPHLVDTLLLASAVVLVVRLQQYPLIHGWLTAKVVGVLLYIALGLTALKLGRTRRLRIAAWFAAQAVFFYIVAVAMTHSPFPGWS